MIDEWKICYLPTFPNGELLDKDHPFQTAYIYEKTQKDAVLKLKEELPGLKLKIHHATHSLVSEMQYHS